MVLITKKVDCWIIFYPFVNVVMFFSRYSIVSEEWRWSTYMQTETGKD